MKGWLKALQSNKYPKKSMEQDEIQIQIIQQDTE